MTMYERVTVWMGKSDILYKLQKDSNSSVEIVEDFGYTVMKLGLL